MLTIHLNKCNIQLISFHHWNTIMFFINIFNVFKIKHLQTLNSWYKYDLLYFCMNLWKMCTIHLCLMCPPQNIGLFKANAVRWRQDTRIKYQLFKYQLYKYQLSIIQKVMIYIIGELNLRAITTQAYCPQTVQWLLS